MFNHGVSGTEMEDAAGVGVGKGAGVAVGGRTAVARGVGVCVGGSGVAVAGVMTGVAGAAGAVAIARGGVAVGVVGRNTAMGKGTLSRLVRTKLIRMNAAMAAMAKPEMMRQGCSLR